jgi:hypothetical protein
VGMGVVILQYFDNIVSIKKSLKMPKGESEYVNRRGTDNAMTKRK